MTKKHKTKIFCDSADFNEIKKLNNYHLVSGFTTNPSLMKKSGAKSYLDYSKKILKICKNSKRKLIIVKNGDHSLSKKSDLKKICNELNHMIFNRF